MPACKSRLEDQCLCGKSSGSLAVGDPAGWRQRWKEPADLATWSEGLIFLLTGLWALAFLGETGAVREINSSSLRAKMR